jgi:type VI protein secretion system component VasF
MREATFLPRPVLAHAEAMARAERRGQRIRVFVYAVLAAIIFAWCAAGGWLLWWATR